MSIAIDMPTCVRCGAPAHVRSNGTIARHCSTECYRRDEETAERTAAYGDLAAPWSLRAPKFGPHLPGRVVEMRLLNRRYGLSNAIVAHGVVSTLSGHPHNNGPPNHALWPDPLGDRWWVHLREEPAKYLASRRFVHRVARDVCEVQFGVPLAIRAPDPIAPGRYRCTIEAQTPIVIRAAASTKYRVHPTGENIASTLGGVTMKRLGLDELPPHLLAIAVTADRSREWEARLGAERKPFWGWEGSIDVECSALTRWLLACAERISLGGRVGFGFGRIRITEAR